ncbi:hypothetical protein GCM10023264_16540 [Sphingomonas daechungensis]|uniref:Uncharacterized protein n=1 Tax=Sphingomonas daechungensis TaxID=1176646 RepID=A0ABX6T3S7_9SPHN|nr:hypothetical protein [Sphingomonas daechungensis]QNP44116.1 hypothetical protein H9L15_06155 [Sphingomonas daechungensis]
MLTLLLASTIAATPAQSPSRTVASASAQATVRIVRGAEMRWGRPADFEASVVRASTIRERDGSRRTASLVEFY